MCLCAYSKPSVPTASAGSTSASPISCRASPSGWATCGGREVLEPYAELTAVVEAMSALAPARWDATGSGPVEETVGSATLTVTVQSFSYKRGLPEDPTGNGGGHIFDCRALPNPGRYEQYRAYTGKDRPVIEFLEREPAVDTFLDHARAIVGQSVDKYLERRFTHLSVAFGCTGGQHRSVYCAERMAQWLRAQYPQVTVDVVHRER